MSESWLQANGYKTWICTCFNGRRTTKESRKRKNLEFVET